MKFLKWENLWIGVEEFSEEAKKQQVVNQAMEGHLDTQTARLQQMEAAIAAMISH